MIELALFGLGLVLCLLSWRWMYQPSLLDQTRDKVFDLREKVRSHFIEKGFGLDHPLYKSLRDLLNGHLRYTRDASVIRFVSAVVYMQKNQAFAQRYKARVDKQFATDNPELARFATDVRLAVFAIMLEYMVKKSFLLLVFLRTATVIDYLKRAVTEVKRAITGNMTTGAFVFARAAAMSGLLLAVGGHFGLGSRAVAQEAMESCALGSL